MALDGLFPLAGTSIPQGRIGQPDDRLGLAGFLFAAASSATTGVVITQDGGAAGCC